MNISLDKFLDNQVSYVEIKGNVDDRCLEFDGRKIEFVEPISYEGQIYRVDREFYIDINIHYNYREVCGRCLGPVFEKDSTSLRARLTDQELDVEDDYEEVVYYEDSSNIDLTNDIKSMVILALPMKPICSKECKGLCSVCGINLNNDRCDCVVDTVDPRLAGLKDLIIKD